VLLLGQTEAKSHEDWGAVGGRPPDGGIGVSIEGRWWSFASIAFSNAASDRGDSGNEISVEAGTITSRSHLFDRVADVLPQGLDQLRLFLPLYVLPSSHA
jgi:hypothetical protein